MSDQIDSIRHNALGTLEQHMESVDGWLISARSCLGDGDYFQCAVRLAKLGVIFDDDYMAVLDVISTPSTD